MKRIVQPEWLDALSPGDPRAIRSRRDLRRINWWMRNHVIMAHALKNYLSAAPQPITELGAGDGNFLLQVAHKMNFSNAAVILLDRQKNVSAETLDDFAKLGWRAEAVVADVFDWPQTSGAGEVVIANLFLHHFQNERLAVLLQKISERTKLVIALEPRRARWPLFCSHVLWAIGCNDVTRHDAVVSVRAGFTDAEISALWPDKTNWQLTEHRAGPFGHLFIARRRE